jgi:ketosteroid isomerase-like protein
VAGEKNEKEEHKMKRVRKETPWLAVLAGLTLLLYGAAPLAAQGRPHQAVPSAARGSEKSQAEIRAFFDEYLRLHAAPDMDAWVKLFLPEAIAVRTADDGKVIVYRAAELAASIAEEAKKLDSQHETFEDVRMDIEGDAAVYSALWRLYHNGREIRHGRAWFLLARKDQQWRISALTWYRAAGGGAR